MKSRLANTGWNGLGVAGVILLGCAPLWGVTPGPQQQQGQQTPSAQPRQKPPDSNPFPEDTNTIPVMPNGKTPEPVESPRPEAAGTAPALPPSDVDPVRSPDEPLAGTSATSSGGSSSSSADVADILAPPPDDETRKARKGKNAEAPEHQETAQEDESVGAYYLGQKNWKAALSRFQSALVLDPENPDVYWGLAEAQRHVGDTSGARTNYQKVMEYDPDSKHAREAKKLLQDPEMAASPNPLKNAR